MSRRLRWIAAGAAVALLAAGATAVALALRGPLNSPWVLRALAVHFGVPAQVKTFHAHVLPRVAGEGTGLRLLDRSGRPFATVAGFQFAASWPDLWRRPPHMAQTALRGLVLNIHAGRAAPPAVAAGGARPRHRRAPPDFVLERVNADGALLRLIPANPAKPPREFPFQRLRLARAGAAQALGFNAEFLNPKPLGKATAQGSFGPWNDDDPAATALSGHFDFGPADLATLSGIAGTLLSQGEFTGALGAIAVHGDARIARFGLGDRGHPVEMTADYRTLVDGQSGDTVIRSVTTRFLNSLVGASGRLARGPNGDTLNLDFQADPARIEDFLILTVSAPQPLLTGAVRLQGALRLPPGPLPVDRRLQMTGRFTMANAAFTAGDTETELNRLSRIGQGAGAPTDTHSVFDLAGAFTLDGGIVHFTALRFRTPGATVTLAGQYDMNRETLDLAGHLQLAATLSQMTTGLTSLLLRPFNRLLSGPSGGTRLPLEIRGPRQHPHFSVDWRQAIHRP